MKKLSHQLLVFAFSFLLGIMIRKAVVDFDSISIGQWVGSALGVIAIFWSFALEIKEKTKTTSVSE